MTATDQMTEKKERAVRNFMSRFQNISTDWVALVAEHKDDDECVSMPMWGTVFMPESCFAHSIRALLTHPVPKDAVDLLAFAEEHDIEVKECDMRIIALAIADDGEVDLDLLDEVRDSISEAWRDQESDDAALAASGWLDVGGTGFIAREFDGDLVLGVNGAGYSFVDSHWQRLYDELGLTWHEQDEGSDLTREELLRTMRNLDEADRKWILSSLAFDEAEDAAIPDPTW